MKTDSTLLDYTKSAEEIRKFKLKEECHKIAAEYERFNIENGVYEKFGEWLLEKAKDRYKAEFNNFHLTKIVTEMELECPENYKIKANTDDYDWCDELRGICPSEWSSWGEFRSCYSWYTIWRIAKTVYTTFLNTIRLMGLGSIGVIVIWTVTDKTGPNNAEHTSRKQMRIRFAV